MKTILVPTDFSKPSKNAAYYSLHLANALHANVHLCHAFAIPNESPLLGQVTWAVYEYPDVAEDVGKALKRMAKNLEKKEDVILDSDLTPFHPAITYSSDEGDMAEFINKTANATDAVLIVMGMTGAGKLNRFIFGGSTMKMIEESHVPLLLIPYHYRYTKIEKIAFTTDLSKKDEKKAEAVARFAQYFDAELLVTHVADFTDMLDKKAYEQKKEAFMKNIVGKTNYLLINADGIDHGLDILKNKDLDLWVMGHAHKKFFDRLTMGSHTARQVRQLEVPILVIPEGVPVLF